jgi:hypothetical protein
MIRLGANCDWSRERLTSTLPQASRSWRLMQARWLWLVGFWRSAILSLKSVPAVS